MELWIGHLPNSVTESDIVSTFSRLAPAAEANVIIYRSTAKDVLSFAKVKLSGQVPEGITSAPLEFCGVKAKVASWAATKEAPMEQDFNIYVGGLATSVTKSELLGVFACEYPSVRDAMVVMDKVTGISKGYGFVRFGESAERDAAIRELQGHTLHGQPLNLALGTHRSGSSTARAHNVNPSLEADNIAVYISGFPEDADEDAVRKVCEKYGEVLYIKIPSSRSCAFCQYKTKQDAVKAIEGLKEMKIGGRQLVASWGKEQLTRSSNIRQAGCGQLYATGVRAGAAGAHGCTTAWVTDAAYTQSANTEFSGQMLTTTKYDFSTVFFGECNKN